jgi:hypothetical protein
MDDNAQRINTLRCDDMEVMVQRGLGVVQKISLPGKVACQRPRNFRMDAGAIGSSEVDLGSNDQEFWFWIKRNDPPYQFYCPYSALTEGKGLKIPFPFQPEWVMETLGMGNYGPATRYQLVVEPDRYKLIERTQGPQGNMVRKIIVFNKWEARGNAPQVTDYLLIDDRTNQEICSAKITEVQTGPQGGVVPRRMVLYYPEAKVRMTLTMPRASFNTALPPTLFVRQPLRSGPSYNMATGRLDSQPSGFQRAGGVGGQ